MSDDNEDVKSQLSKYKPKKKKMAVPKEFLEGANSYDDKLNLVKILSEREKNRVVLILKSMLKDAVKKKDRV
jgi:hypothetical protein